MPGNPVDWQELGLTVEVDAGGIHTRLPAAVPQAVPAARGAPAPPAGTPSRPADSGPVAPDLPGPTLLGMAVSATKSLVKYAASGFQRVDAETQQRRIAVCAACPYHRGTRCHVCGCFTDKKAWLPHEDCPIGRWPA